LLYVEDLVKFKWDLIIYDEAHRLKNNKSKINKVCVLVVGLVKYSN
jgi:SNF2 family DNA or RNA helicase